jgi:hypothetical protein
VIADRLDLDRWRSKPFAARLSTKRRTTWIG